MKRACVGVRSEFRGTAGKEVLGGDVEAARVPARAEGRFGYEDVPGAVGGDSFGVASRCPRGQLGEAPHGDGPTWAKTGGTTLAMALELLEVELGRVAAGLGKGGGG